MAIGGILFDKDGTLIDFPATWLPVLKALALEFSGGHQPLTEELLIVAGYDRERDALRGGSIWAAGNTMDLIRAWKPGLTPAEQAEWLAFVDDFCSEHAPDSAVPIRRPGTAGHCLACRGPAASSAHRCADYDHTVFVHRHGPHSPSQRQAAGVMASCSVR